MKSLITLIEHVKPSFLVDYAKPTMLVDFPKPIISAIEVDDSRYVLREVDYEAYATIWDDGITEWDDGVTPWDIY